MKKYLIITLLILAVACENQDNKVDKEEEVVTVEGLKEKIQVMDDSLAVLTTDFLDGKIEKIDRLVYHEAINRNIDFYNNFPDNNYAPFALEKVSSMYMALNVEKKAAEWRDTLLVNYPDFDRSLDILELQKSYYDGYESYNKEKVEHYIEKMLEHEKLSDGKREDLEYRLENIDLSYKELIQKSNPDLEL